MVSSASRGPGRPPAAKAADTRKRIIESARKLFVEVGYDAATFQEIAVRADLTRPAINHYFQSKRELYREVLLESLKAMVSDGAARAFETNSIVSQLSGFVENGLAVYGAERTLSGFLINTVIESYRHPELYQGDYDPVVHTRAFAAKAVADAIERGEVELRDGVTAESVSEMICAMMVGIAFYAEFIGSHETVKSLTEYVVKLFADQLWVLKG